MRLLLVFLICAKAALPAANVVSLRTVPAQAVLKGARSSQQFVAIAQYSDGTERDVTSAAEWHLSNPASARFVSVARVAPAADGSAILTASFSGARAKS